MWLLAGQIRTGREFIETQNMSQNNRFIQNNKNTASQVDYSRQEDQ